MKLKCTYCGRDSFTVGKIYNVETRLAPSSFTVPDDNNSLQFVHLNGTFSKFEIVEEKEMHLLCLSSISPETFTLGKTYKVLGVEDNLYKVKDNTGFIRNVPLNKGKYSFVIGTTKQNKPRFEVAHIIIDNEQPNEGMQHYRTLAEAQEVCDEMNAPKVMKPKYTKEVEYFGMKILVPDDAKYLATNSIGYVHASNKELTISNIHDHWCTMGAGNLSFITKVDLNGIDWCDTLVEVK